SIANDGGQRALGHLGLEQELEPRVELFVLLGAQARTAIFHVTRLRRSFVTAAQHRDGQAGRGQRRATRHDHGYFRLQTANAPPIVMLALTFAARASGNASSRRRARTSTPSHSPNCP